LVTAITIQFFLFIFFIQFFSIKSYEKEGGEGIISCFTLTIFVCL